MTPALFASFVLVMPESNSMHVISFFGLAVGQLLLLSVLNARFQDGFQLKMGPRAPFGSVW